MTRLLLALLGLYRLVLSPLLALFGARCRFEPSCSRYASACIESHGPVRGSLLSMRRVSKCHPFHPGGFDPPPAPRRTPPPPVEDSIPPPHPPFSGFSSRPPGRLEGQQDRAT